MNKKQLLIEEALPHNFLAEKMVLSCLILNSDAIELTLKTLPLDAFYFKNHKEMYKAILYMHHKNISIDILSLTAFLQKQGLLDRIGGIQVLLELINQVPNLIYLEEYSSLVKEKFARRSLIKFGYKLINSGYLTNIPLSKLLASLDNELFTLTNDITLQKTLTSANLLNQLFSELKENFLKPTLPGLSSGFSNLDQLTQGFQKSDLIILAARPSMGKTALSLNIALNSLKNSQLPILFFSLEMSKEQLMYRILSSETNINQQRLKNGNLYKIDWIKLNKAIKILSKLRLFIEDKPQLTVQDIRLKLKTILLEQSEVGLVIIDYLQLMNNFENKNENRVQELSKITRSLKMLAREFNIPIMALSQLNRNVENRVTQKPMLSDLKESGSIEQDADLVLLLGPGTPSSLNPEQKKNLPTIDLTLAKHRNGPTGTIELIFNEKQIKFYERE